MAKKELDVLGLVPAVQLNIEERIMNWKIVQLEMNTFIINEMEIVHHIDVMDGASVLENLANFNLLSVTTTDGVTAFRDICRSNGQQLLVVRLANLELLLSQYLGVDVVAHYRYEFYESLLAYRSEKNNRKSQLELRVLIEDYPYMWLLPHLQAIYKTKTHSTKL